MTATKWLVTDHAADALGVSARTLQRRARMGRIQTRKGPNNSTLYAVNPDSANILPSVPSNHVQAKINTMTATTEAIANLMQRGTAESFSLARLIMCASGVIPFDSAAVDDVLSRMTPIPPSEPVPPLQVKIEPPIPQEDPAPAASCADDTFWLAPSEPATEHNVTPSRCAKLAQRTVVHEHKGIRWRGTLGMRNDGTWQTAAMMRCARVTEAGSVRRMFWLKGPVDRGPDTKTDRVWLLGCDHEIKLSSGRVAQWFHTPERATEYMLWLISKIESGGATVIARTR
jgi:hypothetical protein